jgi:hypothetical protein
MSNNAHGEGFVDNQILFVAKERKFKSEGQTMNWKTKSVNTGVLYSISQHAFLLV